MSWNTEWAAFSASLKIKNPPSHMTFTFNTEILLLTSNTKVAEEYIFTES